MNLDSLDLFWQALAGLIVVVGPWKAGIVFAERTGPLTRPDRLRTAIYTVAIATVAGLVFIFVGEPLVDLFHISEGAFLIGAGLIVIVFSISLVISDERPDDPGGGASKDSGEALRLAVYPLSVPLVITPPGIASLIALGVLAHVNDESLLAIVAAFLVVMGINLVVFLIESRYEQVLHPTVYQVAGRLLGVLLVAFGVSIGLDGLAELKIIDL